VDIALGIGNPDPHLIGGVRPAWEPEKVRTDIVMTAGF
jgi:hypothetical protein